MSFDNNFKNTIKSGNKINLSINDGRKSIVVAYLLWLFLGWLGIHRMYLGRMKSGVAMLIMMCAGTIIPLFAGIVVIVLIFDVFYTWRMVENYNRNYEGTDEFNIEVKQDKAETVTDLEKYSVLEKIHDLRVRGIITEEEFIKKRKEIFGETSNKKDEVDLRDSRSQNINLNKEIYSPSEEAIEEDMPVTFSAQSEVEKANNNHISKELSGNQKYDIKKEEINCDLSQQKEEKKLSEIGPVIKEIEDVSNVGVNAAEDGFFTTKFSDGIKDAYTEVKHQVSLKLDTFDRLAKLKSSGVLSAEELEVAKNKILNSAKKTLDKATLLTDAAHAEIKDALSNLSGDEKERIFPMAWIWSEYKGENNRKKNEIYEDNKSNIGMKKKLDEVSQKVEALKKLAELRDSGILTQSEFENEKSKLL